MNTGSQKAWASAAATLFLTLLAMFGLGDMPAPATLSDAAATIGATLGMSAVSWVVTYWTTNKPKEPPA